LASGLAVVASDVGGNCELIRHGENGLVVPADAAEPLAAALRLLSDRPDLLATLRDGARTAVERYSWDAVAERYLAVYREVVRPATRRRAA
jgi:glycosyltransferase involved in cell wall biosynthesis